MAEKKTPKNEVSTAELESLNALLKQDPALFARVSEVVALSQLTDGKIRKIDEVEGELIDKINRLGQQTLSSFDQAVEAQAADTFRSKKTGTQQREKNVNLLQHLWSGQYD